MIIIICKIHEEFQTIPKLHLGKDSKNIFKRHTRDCGKWTIDNFIIDFQKVFSSKYDCLQIELKHKSFLLPIIYP